jgi:hypothetical protein
MFKPFNRYAQFKPSPWILPRDAGEETEPALSLSKGGGLNEWNALNDWNASL